MAVEFKIYKDGSRYFVKKKGFFFWWTVQETVEIGGGYAQSRTKRWSEYDDALRWCKDQIELSKSGPSKPLPPKEVAHVTPDTDFDLLLDPWNPYATKK